jgi:hypothetical protein
MVGMRGRVSKALRPHLVTKPPVDRKTSWNSRTIRGGNWPLEVVGFDYVIEGINRPVKAMAVGANHALH